jgi:hypothetical protein
MASSYLVCSPSAFGAGPRFPLGDRQDGLPSFCRGTQSRLVLPRGLPAWPCLTLLVSFVALAFLSTGCIAVVVAGKAVTTTVGVAADVTAATVRGTGKVAAAAVGASGDVADESVHVAAKLSKTGMVVFFDPKSGAVWEAPWRDGLKLFAAAEAAKIDVALTAVRVIRAGKAFSAASNASVAVKSGDVVELARRA